MENCFPCVTIKVIIIFNSINLMALTSIVSFFLEKSVHGSVYLLFPTVINFPLFCLFFKCIVKLCFSKALATLFPN